MHLHARNPQDGRPDQSPEAFAPFLKVIKQRSNVVINITTGGAPTMTIEERVRPAATFKPEVASLNMGTMNFGLYPMLARFKEFKHDWEKPYLEGTRKGMFKNTFADIEYILTTCADNGTRFEIECYDIGHLYTLTHFLERGVVKPPLFVQSVFGILGGIGTHPEDVMHMKRTADRLLGADNYHWSVLGAGRSQMPIAAQAAAMGGNVRVGLEDFALARRRQARRIQCRAGHEGARHHRGPRARNRHARRGARNPHAQGRRQGRVLTFLRCAAASSRYRIGLEVAHGRARHRQRRHPAGRVAGAGRHPVESRWRCASAPRCC